MLFQSRARLSIINGKMKGNASDDNQSRLPSGASP